MSPHHKEAVGKMIPKWVEHRYTPKILREVLLEDILRIIPVEGPSSVIHLTNFFSQNGKYKGSVHRNVSFVSRYLFDMWCSHLKKGDSDIEKSLSAKSRQRQWGVATLSDLISQEDWENSPLHKLALMAGTGDMAYLWMRCSSNELWGRLSPP